MKQLLTRAARAVVMTILTAATVNMAAHSAAAQFTFMGDYDRTFAAPKGYYVDPENPDPTVPATYTYFQTGAALADGSLLAGGRYVDNSINGDFYIRKFTPAGQVDASFGSGGFVRTNFHSRFDGIGGNEIPTVMKVQPDGKILFAGMCTTLEPAPQTAPFGVDACVVRYNANGSLDTTFGGPTLVYTSQGTTLTHVTQIEPGKMIMQTGTVSNGQSFGTHGTFNDILIQSDGKIVLVGQTRNYSNFFGVEGYGGIVVRLNANGTPDTTFGTGGIARWTAPMGPVPNCYPDRGFQAAALQADGRIVAVGYDEFTRASDCSVGGRFAVTRWTNSGQLETVRHITEPADPYVGLRERAAAVLFSRDGSKILVSGSSLNRSQAPAGPQKATLIRLNAGDLSLDTGFGENGISQYNVVGTNQVGTTLSIKAIQPDGKIIASDDGFVANSNGVVRFNPDGSPDNSFGNISIDNSGVGKGRLRLEVTIPSGQTGLMERSSHVVVQANGRIALLSQVGAFGGVRAVASRQNTNFQSGIYADFDNDGRDDLSVFRPENGVWFNLAAGGNNYSAAQWGIGADKLAPADFDGDGKTDKAVFRNGVWYIDRSSDGTSRVVNFGLAGDLPRPGDFDGDGLADLAVFRPSNGVWYRINSSNGEYVVTQFGANGDVPMLGDHDGDGRTDLAVFRPAASAWYVLRSSDGQARANQFGAAGDIPVNGDFDGDSRSDLAVFRPSNGTWYIARNSGVPSQNYDAFSFGLSTDRPVPADYDNDGKADLAVFRSGQWWIKNSGSSEVSVTQFGLNTDRPIAAAYLP